MKVKQSGNYRESDLQRACVAFTRLAMPDVSIRGSMNGIPLQGEPEERGRLINQMKLLGMDPGEADLILSWAHKEHGAVELKIIYADGRRNKLSPAQEKWRDDWIKKGNHYAVCYTIEEYDAAVRSFGIKPRCAPMLVVGDKHRGQIRQNLAFELFKPESMQGEVGWKSPVKSE